MSGTTRPFGIRPSLSFVGSPGLCRCEASPNSSIWGYGDAWPPGFAGTCLAAFSLLPLLLLGGCSGGTPEDLYPVAGTVRVGDRLLDSGTIQFEMIDTGQSGQRYTSTSTIDAQGRFRLQTFGQDGAPAGRHRVWVSPDFARMPDEIGTSNVRLSPIPKKYMMPTSTDLELEVKAEENELDVQVPGGE